MTTDKIQPLVTVYMPTYNRVNLLQRAVESVLSQDYRNIELIVVDDNSTDGTHQYLAEMAEKDSRFRYFINEKNSGACVSRNKAIFEARGKFVTGLDDDDYFHTDRIKVFVNQALKNEDNAYFSTYNTKISDNRTSEPSILTVFKRRVVSRPDLLLRKNFIGNQIFVKTEYLRNSGGFDPKLKAWQDLECWYNLLKSQEIKAILIKKSTQTVDISHDHERITTQKTAKILESYHYLISKHKLTPIQRATLENQLVKYTPERYNILKRMLLFILSGNRSLILKF